ncbi:hypothetical protein DASB73_012580 [Starmerella bacillaris]|uniref:AB hydrolase-1 domain-containing protein n=1 Tax=Starmerella bacillaris TaxID=1247836 RepID=A0AAV5RFW3_STABA|nr:hypothetical protein DASB73_012580 [Starmerella bacillaris]
MKDILIGGVKATVLGEDKLSPHSKATLVVLVHGRSSSKFSTTEFAQILMQTCPDLVCCVYDLPNHGSRLIDSFANRSWSSGNANHLLEMLAVLDQGAAEAESLLRYVPYFLPEINVTRRVLIGTSLGGYVAWKVAAYNSDLLSAVVPIISSPDLPSVIVRRWEQYKDNNSLEASRIQPFAIPPPVIDNLVTKARKICKIRKRSLAVLAICGAEDDLVPPQYTAEWAGSAGMNQKVEFFPGVKHEVTRGMIDLTAEYLLSIQTMN